MSRTELENRCSGYDLSLRKTINVWNNQDCPRVYSNILHHNERYDPNQLERVQKNIDNLMKTYLATGYRFTDNVDSSRYHPFQNDLINLCQTESIPGGCDSFLQEYCPTHTIDQIENDNVLRDLCSCYLPNADPCQGSCHSQTSVQRSDPNTGVINRCSNNICIIDNKRKTQCSACSSTNLCHCTFIANNNESIEDIMRHSDNLTISREFCTTAECYRNINGEMTVIACPDLSDLVNETQTSTFTMIVLICVVILIIIAIFIFFISQRNTPDRHYSSSNFGQVHTLL